MAEEAEVHTGGMIALVPLNPETYVVAGGDPAEELHVTLAYLGDDVSVWTDEQRAAVQAVAAESARELHVITARISGHAVWNPDGGPDGQFEPATVYELEDPLEELSSMADYVQYKAREEIGAALMPVQFWPFKPHMTAGYNLDVSKLAVVGNVELAAVRVALGSEVTDYPFTGSVDSRMDYAALKAAFAASKEPVVVEAPEEEEEPPPLMLPTIAKDDELAVTFPVLMVEGMETDDGRFITPGSLTHRALPLSILAQSRNPEGGDGHAGADIIGRMDTLTKIPGPEVISKETGEPFPEGTFIWQATGVLDASHPTTTLVRKGYLRGNSGDLVAVDAEFDFDDEAGTETIRMTKGKIAATTLVPIPAFADGYITVDGEEVAPVVEQPEGIVASAAWTSADVGDECIPCSAGIAQEPPPVVASSAPTSMFPPAHAFADPVLPGLTPLTLDDSSIPGYVEIFGHLAGWGTCHTGFAGQCVTPPQSATDYAYFNVGAVRVHDAGVLKEVSAGHITMGEGGHAGLALSAADAAAFYDNVNTVVGDVAAGPDAYGIWVHGVVRRSATPEQVEALRASPLSGDWRAIGNSLELIAALAVNTGGFPIPRARVASGAPLALVAAGTVPVADVQTGGLIDREALALFVEGRIAERQALAARRELALGIVAKADLAARKKLATFV